MILSNRLYARYACLAVLLAVVTSWTNFGHLCGDEYSQIFEFAAWKLGYVDHGDLRLWEFDSQMRPTIQVWMVVGLHRLFGLFVTQVSPFALNYAIYLLSGLLSIASILVFTDAFISRIQPKYRDYLVILSLFSWLVLYTNPHFNSENISGHLLLLAVGLLYRNPENPSRGVLLAVGLILGLSFSCRFQLGFAILGLTAWFFITTWKRGRLGSWVLLMFGLLLSVSLFTLLADYFFYGKPVLSPYNYYHQNIATGTMNRNSGVSPWYSYLLLVCIYLPFGPAYVLSTINQFLRYPRDILTWTIAPFVLFHFLVGHKEVRFLLPMLGFMPLLIMVSLDDLQSRRPLSEKSLKAIIKTAWVINILACVALLVPTATEIGAWRYLHNHYKKPTLLYFNASVHQKLLYYRRPNLQVIDWKTGDPPPAPAGFNSLLAVNANSPEAKPELPLVYSFFPFHLDRILPSAIVRSIGHFDLYEIKNVESQ